MPITLIRVHSTEQAQKTLRRRRTEESGEIVKSNLNFYVSALAVVLLTYTPLSQTEV